MPKAPPPFRSRSWLLIGLSLASAAGAQTVSVTVDATQAVRTVDERVFGLNSVIWDPDASDTQTVALLKAAGVRMIRIPGGSLSDEYHWSTNRSFSNLWTWATSMNGFAALLSGLNCQAVATANYGTGTPQEAAAWVAYANASSAILGSASDVTIGIDANGKDWKTAGYWSGLRAAAPLATDDGYNFLRLGRSAPIGIKYWEIGNECYGSWETDQQAAQHDPYTYAQRAKLYISMMKAVDPSIKIGAVAVTGEDSYANNTSHPAANPRTGLAHDGWTPVMLSTFKAVGAAPDMLVYHQYPEAPGQESDAALLRAPESGLNGSLSWAGVAADLRQQLADYLGTTGSAVELVVTENNSVFSDPGKQSTSLVDGLYLADNVGSLLQTEFNGYLWWAARNGTPTQNGQIIGNMGSALYGWRMYGDYGVLSTPATGGASGYYGAYPTYYAMKLLSDFARGGDTIVKASSGGSLLSVYAAKRAADGSLALLVVNKDPANAQTASIALTGFTPASSATVYTYGMAQDNAAKAGGASGTDVATSTMSVSGSTFSASFAPYSMSVIALTQGSSSTGGGGSGSPGPSGGGGSGGGGGGAPSGWFLAALALVVLARAARMRGERDQKL